MFKIQSGDDLEQVQKTYIIGHKQTKNIIIEKNDIEHETNARFDENILILDFNFDILYLQSARFDFSWVFQRFFLIYFFLDIVRSIILYFYRVLYLKKALFSIIVSFSILWEAQLLNFIYFFNYNIRTPPQKFESASLFTLTIFSVVFWHIF